MNKEKDITLRVTEDFKKQISELAKKESLSVSSYIRQLLNQKLKG